VLDKKVARSVRVVGTVVDDLHSQLWSAIRFKRKEKEGEKTRLALPAVKDDRLHRSSAAVLPDKVRLESGGRAVVGPFLVSLVVAEGRHDLSDLGSACVMGGNQHARKKRERKNKEEETTERRTVVTSETHFRLDESVTELSRHG
jgi:hypothetical protein